MDFKAAAIADLKNLNGRILAADTIARRLWLLGSETDKNKNPEYIMLTERLYRIEQLIAITKTGLKALTPQQRLVLEKFYVNRNDGYIEDLCEELCVEKSTVYRIKNAALEMFVATQYGRI